MAGKAVTVVYAALGVAGMVLLLGGGFAESMALMMAGAACWGAEIVVFAALVVADCFGRSPWQ